jgi:hypothetical protein
MTTIEVESTSGTKKTNEIGSMSVTTIPILTTHRQLRTRATITDNGIATATRMDPARLTKILQSNGVALDPVTMIGTEVTVKVTAEVGVIAMEEVGEMVEVVGGMEGEVDMGEAAAMEEVAMGDTILVVRSRTNFCPFYWLDYWVYWPSFYTFGRQPQQHRLESAA